MIKKTVKLRKEDFGWLACDITTCNVFEISEYAAAVIRLQQRANEKDNNKIIDALSTKFKISKSEALSRYECVKKELTSLGWYDYEL